MSKGDFVYLSCKDRCGAPGSVEGIHIVEEDSRTRHTYSEGCQSELLNTTMLGQGLGPYNYWHKDECLTLFIKEVL